MTHEERNARATSGDEEYDLRPCETPTYNLDDARESTIVAWRIECFDRLGLDALTSSTLALRRDVDRSRVERAARGGASMAHLRAIFL